MEKILKGLVLAGLVASTSAQAAGSQAKSCWNKDGSIVVRYDEEWGATIIDVVEGIGEIGPAESQVVIETLSDVTENCVDGAPQYSRTVLTKEVIAHYQGEEPMDAYLSQEVVICEEVFTGTDSTTCE